MKSLRAGTQESLLTCLVERRQSFKKTGKSAPSARFLKACFK